MSGLMPPPLLRLADYTRTLGPVTRYAIAIASIAMATLLWIWTEEFFALQSPFLLFYPAIVVASLHLGRGPGLLTIALSVLSIAAFIDSPSTWLNLEEPTDITDILLFVAVAVGLVFLIEAQRRARRAAEVARAEAQDHSVRLEREVAERVRAEELLRRSNEDLEDFGHIVSHDLKEPLRGIAITAESLAQDYGGSLGEDGRNRLETLVKLPRRMASLLDALLEYSRVGRADLAVAPTDVKQVVGEVCDGLRPWLEEHHARVEVDGPLPAATCDRARLGQVFSNLIANGVKYNESAEPRVRVGARQDDGTPVFYVADNGIGIEPKHAPRLFRMFSRLHGRERYGGGTGSGLALTKKTVERHGGRIWFESTPGQGTTFYFTLANGERREPGRHARAEAKAHR
jgi:signal transduction histidine kinase